MTSRYDAHKQRRMLRCSACKARSSEREGTPLFDSRLPPERVESVPGHIAEGCGVRQTGRLCKVNRGTVGRLSKPAGEHARDLHDELVGLSPRTREDQFEEKWAFVAKKQKSCEPGDPTDDREGDTRDHVALNAEIRLVVSVEPGGRTAESAVAVVSKVSRAISTSFVERQDGTDRHRNARKAHETYRFSWAWRHHEAVTYLTMYVYTFCWPVRTLRIKGEGGHWQRRSPAMAAGPADHVWSIPEWLAFPSARR